MKRIRGGRGLGDSLYLRPIVEKLIADGHQVTALTDYPDVFAGTGALTEPFTRERINVLAHYVGGKQRLGTTQWDDICASAQVVVPLRTAWTVRNEVLIERLRDLAGGRPLVLVHGGRVPMGRTDGFGQELLPQAEAFYQVLGGLGDCFLVQIGQADQLYALGCDLALNGATSVTDLLDLGRSCDGVVGQCSFAVPLAEVFDRPLLAVWAAKGMQASSHPYVRQITPKKVLSKPSSMFVIDNWRPEQIGEVVHAFRDALRAH